MKGLLHLSILVWGDAKKEECPAKKEHAACQKGHFIDRTSRTGEGEHVRLFPSMPKL